VGARSLWLTPLRTESHSGLWPEGSASQTQLARLLHRSVRKIGQGSVRARSFTTFRAVENHPRRKIIAEVLEAMTVSCRHKQRFARLDRFSLLTVNEKSASGLNDIDLILVVCEKGEMLQVYLRAKKE